MKISFDIWGTLVKASPSFKPELIKTIRKELLKYHTKLTDEQILVIYDDLKRDFNSIVDRYGFQPGEDALLRALAHALGGYHVHTGMIVDYSFAYRRLFKKHLPELYPDTKEVLHRLKNEGHRLVLSSNTLFSEAPLLEEMLQIHGILDCFEYRKFSCRVGLSKPHKKMFFTNEDVSFRSNLHVGDNELTDGACRNYGIEFYQINSNNRTINDLYEHILSSQISEQRQPRL